MKQFSQVARLRWGIGMWTGLVGVIGVAGALAQAPAGNVREDAAAQRRAKRLSTVEGFVTHLESAGFDARARGWVKEQWAQRREDDVVGPFLCEALAVLSPEFKQALDAYEAEQYIEAAERMRTLISAEDPYLSTNAKAFELKALVDAGAAEAAAEKIAELVDDFPEMKTFTIHVPDLHFLLGFSQLQLLQYEQSAKTLMAFLAAHPEAPGRLRQTTMHIVRDLSIRKPGGISDVADLTGYAGRRMKLGKVDDDTKARQAQAVATLDELIKQAEEQEQAGQGQCKSCGGKGCKKCGGSKADGKNPSGAKKSAISGGPTRVGALRTVTARPGEQWGNMRPEQRNRILQTLEGQFPARYRELVKQYYETLAKQP